MNEEDIISIVWVVFAVAAAILSAANARRKKRAAAQRHGRTHQQPVPDQPMQPGPVRQMHQQPDPGRYTQQQSESVRRMPTDSAVRTPRTRKIDHETMSVDHSADREIPEATNTGQQPDAGSVTADNFDLQRAVVYAEILRPKFEE